MCLPGHRRSRASILPSQEVVRRTTPPTAKFLARGEIAWHSAPQAKTEDKKVLTRSKLLECPLNMRPASQIAIVFHQNCST